jgi:hypothetical protein
MTGNTFDALLRLSLRGQRDSAGYGARFELVSDFALQSSTEYGAHIATIEPWGDWASRHADPRPALTGVRANWQLPHWSPLSAGAVPDTGVPESVFCQDCRASAVRAGSDR